MSAYVVRVWSRDDAQAERLFGPFRSHDKATDLEGRIERRIVNPDLAVEVVPVASPDGAVADLEADDWFAP